MSLENLSIRLNYAGGADQQDRMIKDKLRSLKKSLLYSYQAGIITLSDGRKFRALLNKDKLKPISDDKILSIPFEAPCLNALELGLTSQEIASVVGIAPGDVFHWDRTDTDWLVYERRLEESAYFMAEIRWCRHSMVINDTTYKVYLRGATQNSQSWSSSSNFRYNNLNYSNSILITKNEQTVQFFHRFTKVKADGKNWEVAAVNDVAQQGLIQVYLKEDFTNTILEQEQASEVEETPQIIEDIALPAIQGEMEVFPFDTKTYEVVNIDGGTWSVSNAKKATIVEQTDTSVEVKFITGKSGTVNLIYSKDGAEDISVQIKINSL